MKKTLAIRQTLAELLASSVLELFPKAQLLYASSTREGFFVDFIFESPLAKEQLSFIEQRMREKLQKGEEIRKLDMMGESLAHFMRDQGQVVSANLLRERMGEVLPVIQMGNFAHLCERPFEEVLDPNWQPKLKKILQCAPLKYRGRKEEVTRIQGVDSSFLKVKTHAEIGKELFSFWPSSPVTLNQPVEIIWHGKGRELFAQVVALWQAQDVEEVKLPPELTLKEYLAATGKRVANHLEEEEKPFQDFSYGLLTPFRAISTQTLQITSKKNLLSTVTSLLQFSAKTYKMLDLKWHAYLTLPTRRQKSHNALVEKIQEAAQEMGLELETRFVSEAGLPRVSLRVKDVFQKEWTLSTLTLEEVESGFLLSHRLFTSVERLIALLLENHQDVPSIGAKN